MVSLQVKLLVTFGAVTFMTSYERGVEAHEDKTILFQHLNLFIHITYAYSDGAAICTAMFLIFRGLDTLTVPHWALLIVGWISMQP